MCKAVINKSNLSRHLQKCSNIKIKQRCSQYLGRLALDRIHRIAEVTTCKIVARMNDDAITAAVRFDKLLMAWANKQAMKYKSSDHHHPMIRGKLRLLGRFLIEIMKLEPKIQEFSDIYDSEFYDKVIEAVNIVANYNDTTRCYDVPYNGSTLGTLIKSVGERLENLCIREKNKKKNGSHRFFRNTC